MKPEALAVTIRPRVPYEAIDLGLTLLQQNSKSVYAAWMIILIPVLILATIGSFLWPTSTWIWVSLIWWLKPLYDRVILLVLSHAVFGETISARQVLSAMGFFFRSGLIRSLTWGRLSLARSFLLPVWQLEGLHGNKRALRLDVLKNGARSHANWLTITCIHIEGILMFAAIGLVLIMIPSEVGFSMKDLIQFERMPLWLSLLQNGAYLIAVLLVEPVYVASGFTLYLNRRTELEGWDIELAFSRIAARLKRDERNAA